MHGTSAPDSSRATPPTSMEQHALVHFLAVCMAVCRLQRCGCCMLHVASIPRPPFRHAAAAWHVQRGLVTFDRHQACALQAYLPMASSLPWRAASAEPRTIGMSSPGKLRQPQAMSASHGEALGVCCKLIMEGVWRPTEHAAHFRLQGQLLNPTADCKQGRKQQRSLTRLHGSQASPAQDSAVVNDAAAFQLPQHMFW